MRDLAEFLLARIAEDEQPAREAFDLAERYFGGGDFEIEWSWARHTRLPRTGGEGHSFASGAPSPARVLAECDAKRRIVDSWVAADRAAGAYPGTLAGVEQGLDVALCLLSLPYADHPDYQQEWRP